MVYVYNSNMFMVLQVVVRWLYMSYKFCVAIYLITKIYLNTKLYFIVGWDGRGLTSTMHLHSVTLSKMFSLG